jgi:EamA domain-containing membrane protein RarD
MTLTTSRLLLILAVICFAIAVLVDFGALSTGKIPWTDLGLLFGFGSMLA